MLKPHRAIYGQSTEAVTIVVLGETFEVPADIPLIRAFQHLEFEQARMSCDWRLFCFNDTVGCCELRARRPDATEETTLRACSTRVTPGLEVLSLPEGVRLRSTP